MMKILHTSDWHLGHTLSNYDRTEEQRSMIDQIIRIVNDEKPDLFLLCGDVYHTPQPTAAVQTLFSEALVQIHDAHPEMTIVVTAGNHDSSSKHDIFRTPWKALKVHTIGSLNREHCDEHIIAIPGKGYVAAVPYVHERNLPEGFFQQLLDRVQEQNTKGLPVVMTAHTTVSGCDFSGHDLSTEYCAGGIDSVEIGRLGEGYDYLALGHIHHAQFVDTGRHNVRYSGTPVAVSFDESYPHSVSLVTIKEHGATPEVRTIEIENPHPLVTLPPKELATWEKAKQLLRDYPDDIPAYIRLNVEVEGSLPADSHAEAVRLAQGKQCRFCLINPKRKEVQNGEARVLTVEEFKAKNPIDIAQRYAADRGIEFDDVMLHLFQEAVESVNEEKRK